jgi:hypothetical protein
MWGIERESSMLVVVWIRRTPKFSSIPDKDKLFSTNVKLTV